MDKIIKDTRTNERSSSNNLTNLNSARTLEKRVWIRQILYEIFIDETITDWTFYLKKTSEVHIRLTKLTYNTVLCSSHFSEPLSWLILSIFINNNRKSIHYLEINSIVIPEFSHAYVIFTEINRIHTCRTYMNYNYTA